MKTTLTYKLLLLIVFHFPFILFSQVNDPFSDGDFLFNPTWIGDQSHFIINNDKQLQLNALMANTSTLKVLNDYLNDTLEWHFSIQLQFTPSGNNFAQFFLKSSDTSSTNFSTGFFLQFGENLSNDAIELFYKSPNQLVSVCRGVNGNIASSFNYNIKVTYTNPGLWSVYVDENKTGEYFLETTGFFIDTIPMKSLGIVLKYTNSNIDKFIFDNIYFGSPILDSVSPDIVSVTSTDDRNQLIIKYSEPVISTTALNKYNYIIDNQIYPDSISAQINDNQIYILYFNDPFPNNHLALVHISNILDHSGNMITPYQTTVLFRSVERNDILITEIMADPTPQILLPPCEFIELFNRNIPDSVILKGWKIKIGTNIKMLPDITIPYHQYATIVPSSCYDEYATLCDHIFSVSSLSITNDGQEITLLNSKDEVISYLHFSVNWHSNSLKREGGWSLEMKDLEKPCLGPENWDSSESNLGGTPSEQNSINQEIIDNNYPIIEKAIVSDIITVLLYFSEPILSLNNKISFQLDHNIRIFKAALVSPSNKIVKLELYDPLQTKTIYTLTVVDTIEDCCHNMIPLQTSIPVAIPEDPFAGDIVLNEILTDSYQDSDADFIEILNCSSKVIDVGKMRIGYGPFENPEKMVQISSSGYLLFPQGYLAICKNKQLTLDQYFTPYPENLLLNDSLPNFANNDGTIFITDYSWNLIDSYTYSSSYHSTFLLSTDGVSLEKTDPNSESNNPTYWKSAVASVGYATPGYRNSNYYNISDNNQLFNLYPKIITPNNDGIDDFATIQSHFEQDENRVTIQIFDIKGFIIKNLTNNEMVATESFYIWDGTNQQGEFVVEGFYIVQMEYWNKNGKHQRVKSVISVVNF